MNHAESSYADLRCEDHHCGYSWRVFDYLLALQEVGASTDRRCPQCQTTAMIIETALRTPYTEDEWPELIDA